MATLHVVDWKMVDEFRRGVCVCVFVSVFGSCISWVSVYGMIKPAYSELSTWTHLQILFLDFPDLRQKSFEPEGALAQ